ncbi:MAG: hypothetical protein BSOLF_0574 [Candidatus Carbobacillus altaicus]|uniref:Uncharacterized protein n=1 Tax=Candidatus Carbonibacillus altaicus TaxID=2163959 RepID=A0A2R6Y0N2_9BACL|nr:MAG: hypothetical protein BSOLF_0574 [Candidatus Carbobacillus altaicus]
MMDEKIMELLNPYLEEWAICLAAEGTSYRKAVSLLKEWFGKHIFLTKPFGNS